MLARTPDDRVRSYVVWEPKFGGTEANVPAAMATVPDGGATHYWDEQGTLMAAYRPVLGLSEDAWDVYLVYGPSSRWGGESPPAPAYWMHQLGEPDAPRASGPYLDGPALHAQVGALLGP